MSNADHRPLLTLFRITCGSLSPDELSLSVDAPWHRFLEQIAFHRLVIHLDEVLSQWRENGHSEVPRALQEAVRRLRRRAAFGHLAALATVEDADRALAPEDIPFVVLKGPALALELYGQQVQRTYEDVDLLVRRPDRGRAISALTEAFYVPVGNRVLQRLIAVGHFHQVLVPQQRLRLPIELHWSLVDRANLYRIEDLEVFDRLRNVAPDRKIAVPGLALEDEFIYLAIHIAKHGIFNGFGLRRGMPAEWFCGPATGNSLGWFLDLQVFLDKSEDGLDWLTVRRRCERWNVLDEVLETLSVLELLSGGSLAVRARARLEGAPISRGCPRPEPAATPPAGSAWGRRLLLKSQQMNSTFSVRPVRLLLFWRTLLPSPRKLRRYYRWRTGLGGWLPWLYLRHPFHMFAKLLRS